MHDKSSGWVITKLENEHAIKVQNYVPGSADFLGLNEYSTFLVSAKEPSLELSFFNDFDAEISIPVQWIESNTSAWLTVSPVFWLGSHLGFPWTFECPIQGELKMYGQTLGYDFWQEREQKRS